MLSKLFLAVALASGLAFTSNGWAKEKSAPSGCCAVKAACCAKEAACCSAATKEGCCAGARDCCARAKSCCTGAQPCCQAGAACCAAARSCCSPVVRKPVAKDRVVGFVEFDESKLARITARVTGKSRIDKLYVNVTGEQVHKGDRLAELSSPDLVATVQNLLAARRAGNAELQRVARDRLRLWGIDDAQVNEILRTGKPIAHLTIRSPLSGHIVKKYHVAGDYVEEGAPLYDVADLTTVWVVAAVDEDQSAVFTKGLPVRITTRSLPGRVFSGKVAGVFLDRASRTPRVRFAIQNPGQQLRPGTYARVAPADRAAPPTPADLAKTKVEAARATYKAHLAGLRQGRVSLDAEKTYLWSCRWLEAERDLADKKPDQIAALEGHLSRMKNLQQVAEQNYKAGAGTQAEALATGFYVAEAELWLAKRKAR